MMMKKSVAALCLVVVAVLVAEMHVAAAVDCNPMALMPCLGAISGGGDPSQECCNKLKEQQPCFCDYLKNPVYKPYIDSPNARKIASQCGIAIPTC